MVLDLKAEEFSHWVVSSYFLSDLDESIGMRPGELELLEVVAICDHLVLFSLGKLKHEVFRKPLFVPFHLFIQTLCGYAVERG